MHSNSTAVGCDAKSAAARFTAVRQFTERLCAPLSAEDCVIQSMPDVSPTRWHLAHTTWFFETFVLSTSPDYEVFDPHYAYLFNSYYNTVGKQFPRAQRGLLSRPGLDDIRSYRRHVDERMRELLQSTDGMADRLAAIVEIGLHHEQQHQELMLADIKHVLSCNPLLPVYRPGAFAEIDGTAVPEWADYAEGIFWIGHEGNAFAFDNESPAHRVFLESFQVGRQLVTCGEFLQFMEDGGYRRPELWLSLGWQTVCEEEWAAPLYWFQQDGKWNQFTLAGPRQIDPGLPVCHVSYFEADAFARWAGGRLPTEAEWEVASQDVPIHGSFADTCLAADAALHPGSMTAGGSSLENMFGNVWEWTASPYVPYPGYTPPDGALGEYNGKFMCNQYVLRGGSCATSADHIRRTYRNFFPPEARWQFTGIRLSR